MLSCCLALAMVNAEAATRETRRKDSSVLHRNILGDVEGQESGYAGYV